MIKADKAGCFAQCGGQLNTTDLCWLRCFFETVLGPDAKVPGGAVTGMPLSDLLDAWDRPFASEDPAAGGCPPLPHPPLTSNGSADGAVMNSRLASFADS